MRRAGRTASGCLLAVVGGLVALVAYLWSSMESVYGGDRTGVQLVLWALLLGGAALACWGIALIAQPSREATAATSARAARRIDLHPVDRPLAVGDRVVHQHYGEGTVTAVSTDDVVAIRFGDDTSETRLATRFTTLWWAER